LGSDPGPKGLGLYVDHCPLFNSAQIGTFEAEQVDMDPSPSPGNDYRIVPLQLQKEQYVGTGNSPTLSQRKKPVFDGDLGDTIEAKANQVNLSAQRAKYVGHKEGNE